MENEVKASLSKYKYELPWLMTTNFKHDTKRAIPMRRL